MRIFQFSTEAITEITSMPVSLNPENLYWIDCKLAEMDSAQKLLKASADIQLYERHLNDIINPQHPCSYESVQDYYLLIFRMLTKTKPTHTAETKQINFIVVDKILVTISDADLMIENIKDIMQSAIKKIPLSPEIIIYHVLNNCVDQFLLLRNPINEEYEHWENILMQATKPPSGWSAFLDFRSFVRQLSMLSEEQEDAVNSWKNNLNESPSEYMLVKLRDLTDHIRRVQKHTQRLESDISSLVELHYFVLEHRTNEIVRVLTVISCIFMPLTLITGVFGMNFQYMHMLTYRYGFDLTMLSMGIVTIMSLLIFRFRNWI